MKTRMAIIGLVAAALAVCTCVYSPALAQPALSARTADAPSASVQEAWQRYGAAVAEGRTRLLATDAARDPQLRAQGLYFLQSLEGLGFETYVAPRQEYPAMHVAYMPLELSWGMTNPDFVYHHVYLDGAHTYRIFGNRRGNFWTTLQVNRGFWGDDEQGVLANIDFDDLPATPDGSFEIFLGPNPPAHPDGKIWVRTRPGKSQLHGRCPRNIL